MNIVKKMINEFLRTLSIFDDIDGRFESLNKEVGEFRRSFTPMIHALHASLHPVVLFRGSMKFGSDKVYDGYAWAEKADENLIISCHPTCTVKITSITVLNGLYDIVQCRIANLDLIASMNGRFVPGIEFPVDVGEITPANRIYIILKPR